MFALVIISISEFVPEAVEKYIAEKHLFEEEQNEAVTIQKVVSRKCKKYIQKYAEKGKIKDEIMYRCTGFCIDDSDKRMFCFDFFTL